MQEQAGDGLGGHGKARRGCFVCLTVLSEYIFTWVHEIVQFDGIPKHASEDATGAMKDLLVIFRLGVF